MGENWLNFAIVLVIVPGAKCYPNSINPIDVQTKPKILVNTNLVIKSIFKGGVEIIFFSFSWGGFTWVVDVPFLKQVKIKG